MTELDDLMNMGIDKIQELQAEVDRLYVVLNEIACLGPPTDHFDPFIMGRELAKTALNAKGVIS